MNSIFSQLLLNAQPNHRSTGAAKVSTFGRICFDSCPFVRLKLLTSSLPYSKARFHCWPLGGVGSYLISSSFKEHRFKSRFLAMGSVFFFLGILENFSLELKALHSFNSLQLFNKKRERKELLDHLPTKFPYDNPLPSREQASKPDWVVRYLSQHTALRLYSNDTTLGGIHGQRENQGDLLLIKPKSICWFCFISRR